MVIVDIFDVVVDVVATRQFWSALAIVAAPILASDNLPPQTVDLRGQGVGII